VKELWFTVGLNTIKIEGVGIMVDILRGGIVLMPGEIIVPAFIDRAEIRQGHNDKTEEFLTLSIFARVFITLPKTTPLFSELEASLGEKIDFSDEAQIAGLKGRDLRVHLLEVSRSDFGVRITIDDFRPILPIPESPDDTV